MSPSYTVADRVDRVLGVERVAFPEERNLARGRRVRGSRTFSYEPPDLALDGRHLLWWASENAPQWLEVDLGRPSSVRRIELEAAQKPRGHTVHLVRGRGATRWRLLHTFDGITHDRQQLRFTPRRPWRGIRYVRIETVVSPSWVAWREIRILR